jgi:dihydroneopterin aldolase
MLIEISDIILDLDLKKHYDFEDSNAKRVFISITLELPKSFVFAETLEETFDYVPYESKLVKILENQSFELIEQVANTIFEFSEDYSKDIVSCKVEIAKFNVLSNAKKMKATFVRIF